MSQEITHNTRRNISAATAKWHRYQTIKTRTMTDKKRMSPGRCKTKKLGFMRLRFQNNYKWVHANDVGRL